MPDPLHPDPVVAASLPCILIDGPDARHFAQAQFSGNVDALAPGCWQWNAWLDARGRVLALMQLADPGDGQLLAILRCGDPERMLQTLRRYLLRRKASLAAQPFLARMGEPLAMERVERGGNALAIGLGECSLRLEAGEGRMDPQAANAWRLTEIRNGWPELPDGVPPLLPPALGLERLGAVSFDKGCYPGQEIAARLHYRGGHKLRLYRIRGSAPLPVGLIPGPPDSIRPHVLIAAEADDGFEALIVAVKNINGTINILDNIYDVEFRFDA